jgi:hypothetical protein
MSIKSYNYIILYYSMHIYIQYILIPIPIKSQIPRICSQDMLGWSKLLNYSDFQSIPLSQGRTLQFQHERRAFGHFGTMHSGSMEMDISYTSLVMIILGQIKWMLGNLVNVGKPAEISTRTCNVSDLLYTRTKRRQRKVGKVKLWIYSYGA